MRSSLLAEYHERSINSALFSPHPEICENTYVCVVAHKIPASIVKHFRVCFRKKTLALSSSDNLPVSMIKQSNVSICKVTEFGVTLIKCFVLLAHALQEELFRVWEGGARDMC